MVVCLNLCGHVAEQVCEVGCGGTRAPATFSLVRETGHSLMEPSYVDCIQQNTSQRQALDLTRKTTECLPTDDLGIGALTVVFSFHVDYSQCL